MMATKKIGNDFRKFLLIYAEEKRKNHPGWSYAVWAKHLGLKSTSSITKVINGQREPGLELVDKLVNYFRFNKQEEEQFRKLVFTSKKNLDPKLRSSLLADESQNTSTVFSAKLIELFEFRLISNWWNIALRELLKVKGLVPKSETYLQLFREKVTLSSLKESFHLLEHLNLIKRDKNLQFEVIDPSIKTQSEIPSEAIQNYHLQMLDQAKNRMKDTGVDERHFEGITLLVSEDKIKEAKVLIQNFLDEFDDKIGRCQNPDYLYQVQVQFFPITKRFSKKPKTSQM